ncbi:MAG: SCO family protein [Bradyrhizobium sp.]|uniref:SCO family protein n=1 Tax=Bradyrhizobium sp. TaxID=376 RepID=UPI001C2822E0|nr:SCO family protein [Bradyrhizobium sp.]MBU6464956.1 SCO family protein [Pseudomonadota bacterium]MDE2068858.1 SCO family protein [Bradyrhizobium sp.]MDE2244298.1 SCO family protein [Bradyrhizobium sp.]
MANLKVFQRRNSWGSVLNVFCRSFGAGLLATLLMTGSQAKAWNSTDMTGVLPSLDFTMTRASDGKTVTSADFKGKVVLLYFGYTSCPDVCPTTLLDSSTMLKALGKKADDVRVLFVTVDPGRDTLPVLKSYTAAFAPQVVGLRGTPDQLAALAKRYRVAYSVQPGSKGNPPEVTHGSAVYVFDRTGAIRLLFTGLAEPNAKLTGMTADLQQLVSQSGQVSLWQWIENAI